MTGRPGLYPGGDSVQILFQVVRGIGSEFVDDVLVVRLQSLVQNCLENLALKVVVDFRLVVVPRPEPVEQSRVVRSQHEHDVEKSEVLGERRLK